MNQIPMHKGHPYPELVAFKPGEGYSPPAFVLTKDQVELLRFQAQTIVAWNNKSSYALEHSRRRFENFAEGHLIGKMGELAVSFYMRSWGVQAFPLGHVMLIGGDVVTEDTRSGWEVKTRADSLFANHGRVIWDFEIKKIMSGDITKILSVIWCSANPSTGLVTLEGWNLVEEIQSISNVLRTNIREEDGANRGKKLQVPLSKMRLLPLPGACDDK